MTTRILIIGNGVIGSATGKAFEKYGLKVCYYDIDPDKRTVEEITTDYDLIFVCTPTPTIDKQHFNNSVFSVLDTINTMFYKGIIVIKSTVLPGTCTTFADAFPRLKIAHNPEFLTEANAAHDAQFPDTIFYSGANNKILERVFSYFNCNIFYSPTYEDTEILKYYKNTLLAMKVTIANQFYDLCEKHGADYDSVREVLINDKRIGESHLEVTEQRGYGGMCFPKDVQALLTQNPEMTLLQAMTDYNKKIRKGE